MSDLLTKISALEEVSHKKYAFYKDGDASDIRLNYFKIITGDCQVTINTLKVLQEFSSNHSEEFRAILSNNDEAIEYFGESSVKNQSEKLILDVIFQSEMILRWMFDQISGKKSSKARMPEIISTLYGKDYSSPNENISIIRLLWAIRNTVHNQGVYIKKEEGETINHRGSAYSFQYLKPIQFSKDHSTIDLLVDLIESIGNLFLTHKDAIEKLKISHPGLVALEKA